MTTTTPERTVEALWDQELEALMDGEATCVADSKPAQYIASHAGQCPALVCEEHARQIAAKTHPSRSKILVCNTCGMTPVPPHTIRIRAV